MFHFGCPSAQQGRDTCKEEKVLTFLELTGKHRHGHTKTQEASYPVLQQKHSPALHLSQIEKELKYCLRLELTLTEPPAIANQICQLLTGFSFSPTNRWGQLLPFVKEVLLSLCDCRSPRRWAIICWFVRHISRQLDWKRSRWKLNQHPNGMPASTAGSSPHCHFLFKRGNVGLSLQILCQWSNQTHSFSLRMYPS